MSKTIDKDDRIRELHAKALDMFSRMEKVIDELKRLGPHTLDGRNAIHNVEEWLGQLSGRAHTTDSQMHYVRQQIPNMQFVINAERTDKTVNEIAETIEELAHDLRISKDPAKIKLHADTIMHLAADIIVSV